MINRRKFLAGASGGALAFKLASMQALAAATPLSPLSAVWQAWKGAYLTPDGRVVDEPQRSASHSESQGFGLCLAAAFQDRQAFQAIRAWTTMNLRVRNDSLLAWRWLPEQTVAVPDRNNATDGDLFFAWGLLLGASAFGDETFLEDARQIVADLVRECIVASPDGSGLLLLPAADGFDTADAVTINPSYYMPRAMRELAFALGEMRLLQCHDDGLALLERLAGPGLTPDWVRITEQGPTSAIGMSAAFGYEAMRVPLYLLWSGLPFHPAVARAAETYRADLQANPTAQAPTVIDTVSGVVTERSPHAGYHAIRSIVACSIGSREESPLMPFSLAQPYYPGTLHLMSLITQNESYPECYPL